MLSTILAILLLLPAAAAASLQIQGGMQLSGMTTVYENPKILPFGASNTGGQGTGSDPRRFAYRKQMQIILGVGTYEIVGDFTDPDSDATYDVDHDGIGGQTTAQLEARLPGELAQYMSNYVAGDTVILDTGSNDGELDTVGEREGARDNYEDMIDIVYAFNPNIRIIATIAGPVKSTSSGDSSPTYANMALFHDLVETMLLSKQATVPTLIVVDTYEACDSDTLGRCGGSCESCLHDDEHFTETGYGVVGEVIANSIKNCAAESVCSAP